MTNSLKIDREAGPPIIIGKRVSVGGIIGGVVAGACWAWNVTHTPEQQIPAPIAIGLTAAITGVVQIWLVNRYGVTQ